MNTFACLLTSLRIYKILIQSFAFGFFGFVYFFMDSALILEVLIVKLDCLSE